MWHVKACLPCVLPFVLAWMLALQGCKDNVDHVQGDGSGGTIRNLHSVGGLGPLKSRNWTSSNLSNVAVAGSNSGDATTAGRTALLEPSMSQAAQSSANASSQEASFPLAATFWSLGARLLMAVVPEASNGSLLQEQMLMVDTGSSTLVFCQSTLLQEAAYQETPYISCNRYNPGGAPMEYWGPFVTGNVHAGNVTFQDATYSIMAEEEGMSCQDGIQGIFGIAFQQLDAAELPLKAAYPVTPGFTMADCPEGLPPPTSKKLPSPMVKLGAQGGVEKLGIHWSGHLGENQGMLYLDDAAVTNEHYDASSLVGPAVLGEMGWYDVAVQKISVGDQEFTGFGCAPRPGKACVMDTGTPAVTVPPKVFDSAAQLVKSGGSANLTFWLPGVAGEAVALSFDVATLFEMAGLFKAREGENVILGLSMWAFYYTVFDVTDQSVSFIPQQPGTAASRRAILHKVLAEERAMGLLGHGGRRMEELPIHV